MRYRKLGDNFWGDEKVLTLTPEERYVALYCLTGQSNQIGCFPFSIALAAEDTGLDLQIFRERFLNVCRVLSWGYDLQCRVLYIPTWWKYNQPQNANNLKGNLKDLPVLPHSPLVTQFCNNLQHLNPDLHETFTQTLRERYPQRMATQEQNIAEQ